MTLRFVRLVALAWPALLAAGCDVEERTPAAPLVDARPPLSDAGPQTAIWGELTLPPVVLSAWGPSPNELFFAGGTSIGGGFIGRLDGDRIVSEPVPAGPALWWIWGTDRTHIRAAGEGGRVLRRTASGWVAEETGLSERAQLWGGFSAGPDDHWAVGGAVRRGGEKGVVLRKQGDGPWTLQRDPAFPTETNLFKVWGTGPDDVHLVGERGVAIHWNGRAFRRVPTPDPELLFTVHGQPGGPILAVGGITAGRVLRFENEAWVEDALPAVPALNGVYVRPDGTALVSGTNGTLLRRDVDGTYSSLARAELQSYTLHAVFSGRDDWAVGGDLARGDIGVIATNRLPIPVAALDSATDAGAAPPDAGASPPDAAPPPADTSLADTSAAFDARRAPDAARPTDAAPVLPDLARGDARPAPDALGPRDAGPPPADVAVPPPPPDVAVPDARPPPPPDMAAPPPDMGPSPAGPAQPCAATGYQCTADNDCFEVLTPNGFSEPLCLQPCALPADCDPAFGPEPCCAAPGPQILMHYCYAAVLSPGGCP